MVRIGTVPNHQMPCLPDDTTWESVQNQDIWSVGANFSPQKAARFTWELSQIVHTFPLAKSWNEDGSARDVDFTPLIHDIKGGLIWHVIGMPMTLVKPSTTINSAFHPKVQGPQYQQYATKEMNL